jgi:diacylglycerol kinase (ATP)
VRAAAILGLGSSEKDLKPFQQVSNVTWTLGLPETFEDADVILIFGGDGTIHRHLAQLVKLHRPVLVVPRGSGNDFARAINLPHTRHSLSAWKSFAGGANNVRSIDLGVITSDKAQHYFCCIAGIGLDGEVARRANHLPRWLRGNGGYVLSFPAALAKFKPSHLRIEAATDGQTALLNDQPTMLAAFANTPMFGGGMKIAPRAALDDGKLDICLVRKMDKMKLFCLFPSVYFGHHLNFSEIRYEQAESVHITAAETAAIYADGEYVCQAPADILVAPHALQVIVPVCTPPVDRT